MTHEYLKPARDNAPGAPATPTSPTPPVDRYPVGWFSERSLREGPLDRRQPDRRAGAQRQPADDYAGSHDSPTSPA